jgi:hypothetical protein
MSIIDRFLKKCDVREGRTLIVGSKIHDSTPSKPDRRALYKNAVGVDMEAGRGVDRVMNLEDELPEDLGAFEHVECTSVLEHSRRPWLLCANLERLILPGGTIFLSVPWIWRYHAYDHDYYRFSRDGIAAIFPNIEWHRLVLICGDRILKGDKVPSLNANGVPHLARTETFGFGVKK